MEGIQHVYQHRDNQTFRSSRTLTFHHVQVSFPWIHLMCFVIWVFFFFSTSRAISFCLWESWGFEPRIHSHLFFELNGRVFSAFADALGWPRRQEPRDADRQEARTRCLLNAEEFDRLRQAVSQTPSGRHHPCRMVGGSAACASRGFTSLLKWVFLCVVLLYFPSLCCLLLRHGSTTAHAFFFLSTGSMIFVCWCKYWSDIHAVHRLALSMLIGSVRALELPLYLRLCSAGVCFFFHFAEGTDTSGDILTHINNPTWVTITPSSFFIQSSSLVVCDVDQSLKEKLKKFKFRKSTNNAAILSKCLMTNTVTLSTTQTGYTKVQTIETSAEAAQTVTFPLSVKIDMERQLVVLEEEYEAGICFFLCLFCLFYGLNISSDWTLSFLGHLSGRPDKWTSSSAAQISWQSVCWILQWNITDCVYSSTSF